MMAGDDGRSSHEPEPYVTEKIKGPLKNEGAKAFDSNLEFNPHKVEARSGVDSTQFEAQAASS